MALALVRPDEALVHVPREHRHVRVQNRVERRHRRRGRSRENRAGQPRIRVGEEQLRKDPVRLRTLEAGHDERAAQPDHRSRDVQRHQIDGRRGTEQLDRLPVDRRVVPDHHVRLEDDAERKRDRHPDPHARGEEALRSREREQVGPLFRDGPPQFQRTPEELVGEHERPHPDRDVHPDPLQHVGPIDRPEPTGHQVHRRNDQQDECAGFEADPVSGRHVYDVAEPLRLDLDVKDREDHRNDGNRDAHGIGLVEVGQHVGWRHISERLAQRPDARADHVRDRPYQQRPGSRRPKADAVRVEEATGAEERERGVEGRDDRQIEDDEARLPPVEQKVLHVPGHAPVRDDTEHDRQREV